MTYVTNETGLCAWTFEIEPRNRNFYDHVVAHAWEAVNGKTSKARFEAGHYLRELFDRFWFAGRDTYNGAEDCIYLTAMLPGYGSTNHTINWNDVAELIVNERARRIKAGTLKP